MANRWTNFSIRLSQEELERLHTAAARCQASTTASWARDVLLTSADHRKQGLERRFESLQASLDGVSSIYPQLNQVRQSLSRGSIEDLCGAVQALTRQVQSFSSSLQLLDTPQGRTADVWTELINSINKTNALHQMSVNAMAFVARQARGSGRNLPDPIQVFELLGAGSVLRRAFLFRLQAVVSQHRGDAVPALNLAGYTRDAVARMRKSDAHVLKAALASRTHSLKDHLDIMSPLQDLARRSLAELLNRDKDLTALFVKVALETSADVTMSALEVTLADLPELLGLESDQVQLDWHYGS